MDTPEVQFASTSDDVRIAYTQWGEGPDLVLIPGIVSNVEMAWESEYFRRPLERLGRFFRVVAFDKRGIGMSDRFDTAPTSEHRILDILAVMGAAGLDRVHVSGISEGGAMAQIFAADYPERVDRLVLSNSVISDVHRPEQTTAPVGESEDEVRTSHWDDVIATWGTTGLPAVEWLMPSRVADADFVQWQARFERQTATQAEFRRQLESLDSMDSSDAPGRILAPTLITHTLGDKVLNVSHARISHELIPGAELAEFEGDDHFFWVAPYWQVIIDRIVEFLLDASVTPRVDRMFATILFTDIVDSTKRAVEIGDDAWRTTIDAHDRAVKNVVGDFGGTVVKSTGDGALATFTSPSSAVDAVLTLRKRLASESLTIRAGLHTGEVEIRGDDLAGYAVNLAARVEQAASDGEIFVTSTLRDLLRGGVRVFEEAGAFDLKGFEDPWTLYRVI
jgi:class 3 adenylate cyclase